MPAVLGARAAASLWSGHLRGAPNRAVLSCRVGCAGAFAVLLVCSAQGCVACLHGGGV